MSPFDDTRLSLSVVLPTRRHGSATAQGLACKVSASAHHGRRGRARRGCGCGWAAPAGARAARPWRVPSCDGRRRAHRKRESEKPTGLCPVNRSQRATTPSAAALLSHGVCTAKQINEPTAGNNSAPRTATAAPGAREKCRHRCPRGAMRCQLACRVGETENTGVIRAACTARGCAARGGARATWPPPTCAGGSPCCAAAGAAAACALRGPGRSWCSCRAACRCPPPSTRRR